MKLRFIAVLLTLILILSTFSGCGLLSLEAKLDAAEDIAEDIAEYRMEQTSAGLTREQAEAAALEHAGFTADAVSYVHSEYEFDDGVPHYDVQFREGHMEYEYEIHADTGEILSYECDS